MPDSFGTAQSNTSALPLDLRYWNLHNTPADWFRSAQEKDGTVIVWRETGKSFATFNYLDDDKHEHAVILENWGFDPWKLLAALAAENRGRPSWRETTITRRADGLEEDDDEY